MDNLIMLSHFGDACANSFLGFIPWNFYLQMDPANNCEITNFYLLGGNSGIILILLAILDDLFRAVGLLAVAFTIFAGAKFVLSQGSPDEAAKARTTGINALVGLGISMIAIAVTSFVGNQVGNQGGGSVGNHISLGNLPNPTNAAGGDLIHVALTISFGILGAIAFLIIVIAGLQYVLAQGDAQATAKAKNTIIYALVGLVLAIVAQSIVSFAVNIHP